MTTVIEFYPWPCESKKNSWYRHVEVCPSEILEANPGTILNVLYPSGTKVQARVFYKEVKNNKLLVQLEASRGSRTARVIGQPVPTMYKHERAK